MSVTAEETPIRWGILGTGGIAARFVADLRLVPDAIVTAVGSRTEVGAQAFGTRFRIRAGTPVTRAWSRIRRSTSSTWRRRIRGTIPRR